MTTNYPASLDSTSTTLIDNATDSTTTATTHETAHNNLADAVIAIETALGTAPKGTYADVKTRLNAAIYTGAGAQTIQPGSDVVALIVKGFASGVANLQDWENSGGSVLAYVDKSGLGSFSALSINGTPLSSANLSDSASLGVPTGVIEMWPTATAPTGYLICDGSAVSRTTYSTLFGVIATEFGAGNGTTTFNLPNLQGRVPVGYSASGGHADVSTIGNTESGAALSARRVKHNHTLNDPGHTHNFETQVLSITPSGTSFVFFPRDSPTPNGSLIVSADTGVTVGPQTGSEPNDGPAYLVVNFIIRH